MKCSICGSDATYVVNVDKNFLGKISGIRSERYAGRCKHCLDKKENKF